MKKSLISKIALGALLLALGSTSVAKAKEGVYLGGSLGPSFGSGATIGNKTDSAKLGLRTGGAAHLALGYQMENNWRAEFEIGSYVRSLKDASSININHHTYMGNVLYELPINEDFSWHVGGGLGVAAIDMDALTVFGGRVSTDSKTVFAYQGVTGVEYHITESLNLGLTYHILSHRKVSYSNLNNLSLKVPTTQSIELGLRYTF